MLQSVNRALQILDILKHSEDALGVTAIANRLGVAKSTTHRLLSSLEHYGYVQSKAEGRYSLGLKFLEMTASLIEQMEITTIAKPLLEKLSQEVQEIVHLVQSQDGEVVYLDKVEQHENTIRIYSKIGRRAPMYCTGVGKVLLAYEEDSRLTRYFQNNTFHPFTEKTLTDEVKLREEFQKIKHFGYGMDDEEHELGVRCLAAPIFDYTNTCIYALSITGPLNRLGDEILPNKIDKLKNTANEISLKLGGT